MADISVIKLPNNTSLNIKDASALKQLEFADHSLVALTRAGTSTTIDLGEFDTLSVTDLNAGNIMTTGIARFTNGLYGNLTGNADTATKLATARTIRTNLASTSTASFDGSGNITPGVTGTLGLGNGGTGQTSANAAANAFIDSLTDGSSVPLDGDTYIASYADGKNVAHNGTNTYHRRPITQLWAYIKGKADSVYATAAQGTLATNAMPKSGGTFTGAVTLSGDPTANLHAATKQYVDTQLANGIAASDAMVFRGTMGTGGTVTSLPTANVVVGDTYKAISAITVAAASSWTGSEVSAKSGDLVVAMANTPKWIIVPSGDESSGVTSVATGVGLTGGTITGTGTIKAKLKSETNATYDSASVTNTSSRQYAVVPDKSGYLSVNVPWTAYSNGTGISISNGVINHSNAVTAGTAGTSSATSGPTIAIPYVTYDAQGHVTAVGTHTHTVNGALSVTSLSASSYVTVNSGNSGTAGGLALYSTTPTTFGITMRQTSNQGKHGYVQGDWAIYNHMSGAVNRGFIWKLDNNSVASISGDGNVVFNGSLTIGGNAGNTSGCRMEFDSTLKCVNWIFN